MESEPADDGNEVEVATAVSVVAARSGLSAADPTRSRGIQVGSRGRALFPGLTPVEADRFAQELRDALSPDSVGDEIRPEVIASELLVRVELPAILSDGAGPHLLDAAGRLTIAVGPHSLISGARLAMGEPHPEHTIGLVQPLYDGDEHPFGWRWIGRRDVPPAGRVAALDQLDALESVEAVAAWADAGPDSTR